MVLEEKLEIIKCCDGEILEMVKEGEEEDKIEQADVFKEKVQRALIDVTNAIAVKKIPTALVPITSTRESPPFTSTSTPHSSTVTPTPSTSTLPLSTHTLTLLTTKVKLPKLSLKKFN